jgi:type VI protein secretion system component VasF
MGMVMTSARAQQHIASAVQAMEHERAQMQADDRQKKMLADADQLLAMALQLKSAVDQTRKDELSVQVIKQADLIEKLAKSVKDRMRQ